MVRILWTMSRSSLGFELVLDVEIRVEVDASDGDNRDALPVVVVTASELPLALFDLFDII